MVATLCVFAWLQNLLGKLSGHFNERMIDGGLLKILNNMRERKWTDEDITKGIQTIRDVLIREYKELKFVIVHNFTMVCGIHLLTLCVVWLQHNGALREGASDRPPELGSAPHGQVLEGERPLLREQGV